MRWPLFTTSASERALDELPTLAVICFRDMLWYSSRANVGTASNRNRLCLLEWIGLPRSCLNN